MGYIYKVTNVINGHSYIGQTRRTPEYRWAQHQRNAFYEYKETYDSKFHRAIRKYGVDSFKLETVEECDNQLLNEREIYWIKHLDTFNTEHGYNCTNGGGAGFVLSEDARRRIADAETGEKNHYYGMHLSPEHRKKIGDAQRGVKGNRYGKKHTDEWKKKIKLSESSPVVAYNSSGIYMYFLSSMAASRVVGNSSGAISKCIHGKSKTSGKDANGRSLCWRRATKAESEVIFDSFIVTSAESLTTEDFAKRKGGCINGAR